MSNIYSLKEITILKLISYQNLCEYYKPA